MKWVLRVILILLGIVVALILAGCAYQTLSEWNDARTFSPPGELVNVGNARMHIYCTGEGSPTVILDGSFPAQVSNWAWVQPQIADVTRGCSYDRAGIGWSDLGPEPRDARRTARELEALLDRADVEGPYILVGHSLGALTARVFADEYPNQVVGMVLVEGTHPDAWARRNLPEGIGADPDQLRIAPILARLGFFRAGLFPVPPADSDLPTQQYAEEEAYFKTTKYFENLRAVNDAFPAALQQVRETKSLGNKPLVVVVGGASENFTGVLRELQDELLKLSSNSVQVEVDGASHSALVHNEEYADDTAQAILRVVEAVRTGQLLAQ
jgi:pimeloyl-ACP methyl ester carboxylesterase